MNSILKRNFIWITLLLSVLYVLVGLIGINSNSLAGDEPFTVYFSQQSFSKIWSELLNGNNPPLYETLLKAYSFIFGKSILALRMLSLIFVSTSIFLGMHMLKTYTKVSTGLLFGIIVFFADYPLSFAHEVRGYAFLGLLTLFSSYVYLNIFVHGRKQIIGLVLINALLLYTHYLSSFFILFQGIALLPYLTQKNFKSYLLHGLGVILLTLPLSYNLLTRSPSGVEGSSWLNPPNGIESLYNMLWHFLNKPVLTVLIIVLLLSSTIVFTFTRIKVKQQNIYFTLWFAVLFFGMFIISYWFPVFLDRYLMICVYGLYATIAICLTHMSTNKYVVPAISIITATLFITTHQYSINNKRPLKDVTQWIAQHKEKKEAVIISEFQLLHGLAYYANPSCFFEKTNQRADDHLLRCLHEQSFYFQLTDTVSNFLLLEMNDGFQNNAQIISAKQNSVCVESTFFPEFFKLQRFEPRSE